MTATVGCELYDLGDHTRPLATLAVLGLAMRAPFLAARNGEGVAGTFRKARNRARSKRPAVVAGTFRKAQNRAHSKRPAVVAGTFRKARNRARSKRPAVVAGTLELTGR